MLPSRHGRAGEFGSLVNLHAELNWIHTPPPVMALRAPEAEEAPDGDERMRLGVDGLRDLPWHRCAQAAVCPRAAAACRQRRAERSRFAPGVQCLAQATISGCHSGR